MCIMCTLVLPDQAAEKLVLTAFQLQVSEPLAQQEEAKAFLTGLAKAAGEPPGPVIALVRAVVQPAPWGSGYLVVSAVCLRQGNSAAFDASPCGLAGGWGVVRGDERVHSFCDENENKI